MHIGVPVTRFSTRKSRKTINPHKSLEENLNPAPTHLSKLLYIMESKCSYIYISHTLS